MELYLIWRLVDEMWIAKVIEKRAGDDEFRETMVLVQSMLNMVYTPMCGIILIMVYLILPAVYEDIKDNIFLVLGGNRNLWANFYHITLSQSAVKLDLLANLEFWTTFFFVVINFEFLDENESEGGKTNIVPIYVYWIIYGVTLLVLVIADIVGYKSVSTILKHFIFLDFEIIVPFFLQIKNINKSSYLSFFFLRSLVEAAKIFMVVALWYDKTFLLEDINEINKGFF